MTEAPAPKTEADPATTPIPVPAPANTPRDAHVVVDPGDASPIGFNDGVDFVPTKQKITAITVMLPQV